MIWASMGAGVTSIECVPEFIIRLNLKVQTVSPTSLPRLSKISLNPGIKTILNLC